jgi:DNA-directed RNA polymerase specialized sigma24 family protein
VTPPPRNEAQITAQLEANDADYDPDAFHDPWPILRRKGKIASIEALGGDVKIDADAENEEAEKPEPDLNEAITALERVYGNVLTKEEQQVIRLRTLFEHTYAAVAKMCRPQISGPSQVKKIEQRALRKMRERLSKFRDELTPKPDRTDPLGGRR